MKRVYIAGPYSGDGSDVTQRANTVGAIDVAELLLHSGAAPFVPHLYHFWGIDYPHDWQEWLDICLAWVKVSDAVYRIPGPSKGADIECKLAGEIGIPVFTSVSDCGIWCRDV